MNIQYLDAYGVKAFRTLGLQKYANKVKMRGKSLWFQPLAWIIMGLIQFLYDSKYECQQLHLFHCQLNKKIVV